MNEIPVEHKAYLLLMGWDPDEVEKYENFMSIASSDPRLQGLRNGSGKYYEIYNEILIEYMVDQLNETKKKHNLI